MLTGKPKSIEESIDIDDDTMMSMMSRSMDSNVDVSDISDREILNHLDTLIEKTVPNPGPTRDLINNLEEPLADKIFPASSLKAGALYKLDKPAPVPEDPASIPSDSPSLETVSTNRTLLAKKSQEESASQVLSDAKAELLAVGHHMEAVAHQQSSLTHKMSLRIAKLLQKMDATTDSAVRSNIAKKSAATSNTSKAITVWIQKNSSHNREAKHLDSATPPLITIKIEANRSRSNNTHNENMTAELEHGINTTHNSSMNTSSSSNSTNENSMMTKNEEGNKTGNGSDDTQEDNS